MNFSIRFLVIFCFLTTKTFCQGLPRFFIGINGVEPIVIKIDSAKNEDIYNWTMSWVNSKNASKISSIENQTIQFDGQIEDAFTMLERNISFRFDIDYTIKIDFPANGLTINFQLNQVWWHPRSKIAEFSYLNFFNKKGEVKEEQIMSKTKLEYAINLIPQALNAHLKLSQAKNKPRLIQNDFEKGYIKNGVKYSVWQYFNPKKEVELAINHTTGRVIHLIADSTEYVIYKNDSWVLSKLDIHPMPVYGFHNFYKSISESFRFPLKNCVDSLESSVVVTFVVDTLGLATNFNVVKEIGDSCNDGIVDCLNQANYSWIPGKIKGRKVATKFAMPIEFRHENDKNSLALDDDGSDYEIGKILEKVIVDSSQKDELVYTYVEQPAEFFGGIGEFWKWINTNIHYPASARRKGIEGKVFVKFIVEKSGAVTNPEIVQGIDIDCDNEALRVISSMPPWKPGTQNGRAVRILNIMPISFKLH